MPLDHEDDEFLDRDDVERIAHEVIGRQFRLPALFSVVLLIVGFVLGHYVASRHIRDAHGDLEARLARLDAELASVKSQVELERLENPFVPVAVPAAADVTINPFDHPPEVTLDAPLPPEPSETIEVPNSFSAVPAGPVSPFRLSGHEKATEQVAVEGLSRSAVYAAIERLKKEAGDEKESCLDELRPYLDRKVNMPATTVATVVEGMFAAQERRLERVVDEATEGASIELHDINSMFRSAEDRMDGMFPPPAGGFAAPSLEEDLEVVEPSPPADPAAAAAPRRFPKPQVVIGGLFLSPRKPAAPATPVTSR